MTHSRQKPGTKVREVELKFDLEPNGAETVRSAKALAEAVPARADLRSVYFDTAKGRLRKAGLSLRVRRSDGRFVQTVKQASGTAAGLFDRREWKRRWAARSRTWTRWRTAPSASF